MNYGIGAIVFDNWEIVRAVGKGTCGKVYEIEKTGRDSIERAVLKIIQVPGTKDEVDELYRSGLDAHAVSDYFYRQVNETVKEIGNFMDLKGHPHIVGYEDYCVYTHEDGMGWDILVRMELLNTLEHYQTMHPMDEAEVIRMGKEICQALVFCQQKMNLIHQDIKPQNIFVSETGQFKLGDFGLPRRKENLSEGYSRREMENFTAPELYLGRGTGPSVDVYSLGIVMYRCTNAGRSPFFPPYPNPVWYEEREMALNLRMKGSKVPRPLGASDELAEVILKACEYKAADRYPDAGQMLRALERIRKEKRAVSGGWPAWKIALAVLVPAALTGAVFFGVQFLKKGEDTQTVQNTSVVVNSTVNFGAGTQDRETDQNSEESNYAPQATAENTKVNENQAENALNGANEKQAENTTDGASESQTGNFVYAVIACEDEDKFTYLRREASESSAIVLELRKHNILNVSEIKNINGEDWAFATYCGARGWVRAQYLTGVSQETAERSDETYYVMTDTVGLRAEQSKSAELLDKLSYGDVLPVESLENGWAEVTYNGKHGYIYSPCIAQYPTGTYCVDTDAEYGIHFRSTPDINDNNSLGKISNGTMVQVTYVENGWGKISYQGTEGWLKLRYLYKA